MSVYDWHSTSWDLRAKPPRVAVLPVGSVEGFGPHLPVGTVNLLLDAIARRVADRLQDDAYLLPTVPLGQSGHLMGFAGTLALSWRTLTSVVTDMVSSLHATGVQKVAVLVGLGGAACNTVIPRENEIVKTAVRRLNYEDPGLDAIWVQPLTVAESPLGTWFEGANEDVHAGEVVTSMMLHLHPELVRQDELSQDLDHIPALGAAYGDALPFDALCPKGVWGRPSRASVELGRLALEAAVGGTVRYIEETFDELAKMKRRGF